MKKTYVKPVIEIELMEGGSLMAASGQQYGLAQYNLSDEYKDELIDAVDGDESDAKESLFYDTWEDQMW